MNKARLSPNLISFITVRREDWILKISVYKTKHVLLIAQNFYAQDQILIKHFVSHVQAAEYIENLIKDEL